MGHKAPDKRRKHMKKILKNTIEVIVIAAVAALLMGLGMRACDIESQHNDKAIKTFRVEGTQGAILYGSND